jgi:Glycosyltransferase
MSNRRIIVNITASINWRHRPVGIIRVERELTKQIKRIFPLEILPVLLDIDTGKWWQVSSTLFDNVLSEEWVHSENPDKNELLPEKSFLNFNPKDDDRFVTVGSDWSFDIPSKVIQLYGNKKILIPALYDLIPLLLPEFTPGPEFYEQFQRHYRYIAQCAQSVFSISDNSRNDLLDFWQKESLGEDLPPVKVIPLAGLTPKKQLPQLSDSEQIKFAEISSVRYILYVSTIEPRKNHQILLDIWHELHLERGLDCPRLIFVGMRGWGCDNLLEQMDRMNATRDGCILWLQGIKDEFLMHLYANALFTVMPSHYEGWGLAVTESAGFGKVCIISNNSALPEAAGGLFPSYHPLDFLGWNSEIRRMIDDDNYRYHLESRVANEFHKRTWNDFGEDFASKLLNED